MKKIIDEVKEAATKAAEMVMNGQFGREVKNALPEIEFGISPIEFLKKLPWEQLVPVGENFSQEEFSVMNREFDPRGCVGRITLSMYLLEKYFPGTEFQVGEVVVDDLAERMKVMIKTQSNPQKRYEMACELLMYEDPHTVIMIDGDQFDPLVRFVPDLKHPSVKAYDKAPWQVIAAFQLNNQALLNGNLVARDILLQLAEIVCPTRNIMLCRLACKVGLEIVTREDFENFLADGHNARAEYQMLQIFGDRRIFDHYPREVVEILDQEMESEMDSKMSTLLEGDIYA